MANLSRRPSYTEAFSRAADFVPQEASVYISASFPGEERSSGDLWVHWPESVQRVELVCDETEVFVARGVGPDQNLDVRARSSIERFLQGLPPEATVYIDITGMPHHVWIPLIYQALISLPTASSVKVVYIEPREYRRHAVPTEGDLFQLTDRFSDFGPLPGFFSSDIGDETVLVPLLGFEGSRFARVVSAMELPTDRTFPIVGVPGFRPEYPFYSYLTNRLTLEADDAWMNVRYACANCPFSLTYALEDISDSRPGTRLLIALVGTKPHALGAVLFAAHHPEQAEFTYDQPRRSTNRSTGTDKVLVYDIGAMRLASDPRADGPMYRRMILRER